ncbi:CoA pyrophosphatase [Agaribacter flavus]|uniref:CoA pyrophosphatase n=1 Tax=Agaribacter flavus TaxID=1902781 RepID=A0ABV7FLB1_9ALTE
MDTPSFIKAFQHPWSIPKQSIVPAAEKLRPAAVLLCLNPKASGANVILTERAHHLKHHAGQISFPGGKVESSDKNLTHTACREAEEEIGLFSDKLTILGNMPPYTTVSGFSVTPVVACLEKAIDISIHLSADENEVASIFEIPLSFILVGKNYQSLSLTRKNKQQMVHFIQYENRTIWGATAGILYTLYQQLSLVSSQQT